MTDKSDDDPKQIHLKLVSSQSQVKRPNPEVTLAQQAASRCVASLTANLLRIIAGAGKREQLMIELDEAFSAYAEYVRTAQAARRTADDIAVLRQLFLHTHFEHRSSEEQMPETEQAWDRWVAEGDLPERDYERYHGEVLRNLRRSVIRELAAAIAGIDVQRIKYKDEIERALNAEVEARETLRREQRERSNPGRRKLAEMQAEREERQNVRREAEKAKRAKEDQRNIDHLASHHLKALRAVATKDFDGTDNFSLDVLGRIGLITRPKGIKTKSAWELTDLGRQALKIHGGEPSKGKRQ